MSWLSRFTPPIVRRTRVALALALVAAAACADRVATAPRNGAAQHPSKDIIVPPFDDLWVSPHYVNGGDIATGTITLADPAPPGGAHIIIKSTNYSVASLDSNLVVPEGDTIQTFLVQTYPTSIDIGIQLYADWNSSRITTGFIVTHTPAPPPAPSISVTPGTLTFASQAVGTSSSAQLVTVQNTGTVTLTLGVISISGPFTQSNGCPASLSPGQTCSIAVSYVPTAAGAQSGALTVPSDAPTSPNIVTLSGTGFVPTPAISVTPTSIGFGSVPIGTATSGRVVKITSTGSAPLVVSSLTLGGTNPGDFSIASDGCTGVSLLPGTSCTASVSFEPFRLGTRTATLTIASNASTGPVVVSLSGSAVKNKGGYIP